VWNVLAEKRIAETRDKLLLSTTCISKYKKRGDKCRYCEVDWNEVGKSCPRWEWAYHYKFDIKNGLNDSSLDILTYAALENWPKYAEYIGEEELRAEVVKDIKKWIPAKNVEKVLEKYPFLREQEQYV
jgi:hypothetical protein